MFKCFQFIDEMMKQLNEADEMPMEDDTQMKGGDEMATDDIGGGEEAPVPEQGGDMGGQEQGGDAASDPSQIANVDQGQFVSNLGDAEYASIMIHALASNPAFKDKIPQEYLNAQTTQNAQQIIQFCKNLLGLQQSGGETGFNNMSDEQVMNMPV